MPDADQTGHRLDVSCVPTGAAAFQTQAERLRLPFDLTTADGAAVLQFVVCNAIVEASRRDRRSAQAGYRPGSF